MAKPAKKAASKVFEAANHGSGPERRDTVLKAGRVANLDAKRRDEAVMMALCHMEAIFNTIVLIERHALNEIPDWPDFDSACLSYITRALAIRGGALNQALMAVQVNEIEIEDLEGRVYLGR